MTGKPLTLGPSPRGRVRQPPIERLLDWEQRLYQFIEGRRLRPFAWGRHDCALFAADAVQQMTGVDLAAEVRGQYHTAKAARDYGDLADVMDRTGLPRKPHPGLAARGDVVLLPARYPRRALGICLGGVCVAPGRMHLEFFPADQAPPLIAWRVG